MKKLFVYLTIPILLSLQACNNNSASKSTTTDSTTIGNTSADSSANESTDTSEKKNVTHIDAAEVPNAVITAFNNKYPNVADVKWVKGDNKKGKTFYRARWQVNGTKKMAMFADDGSFIKEK